MNRLEMRAGENQHIMLWSAGFSRLWENMKSKHDILGSEDWKLNDLIQLATV